MENKIEKQMYRIPEFCIAYGIGRSKFYQEVAAGHLKITKVGKLSLISKEAARAWIQLYQAKSDQPRTLVAGGIR